jgi:hypothetical protein
MSRVAPDLSVTLILTMAAALEHEIDRAPFQSVIQKSAPLAHHGMAARLQPAVLVEEAVDQL